MYEAFSVSMERSPTLRREVRIEKRSRIEVGRFAGPRLSCTRVPSRRSRSAEENSANTSPLESGRLFDGGSGDEAEEARREVHRGRVATAPGDASSDARVDPGHRRNPRQNERQEIVP